MLSIYAAIILYACGIAVVSLLLMQASRHQIREAELAARMSMIQGSKPKGRRVAG